MATNSKKPTGAKGALEINPVLVSGDSIRIDSEYLTSLLNELGAIMGDELNLAIDPATEQLKQQIHQLFNGLRENDRKVAEKILRDVEEGKISHVDSFRKVLDEYKNREVDRLIGSIIGRFGLDKERFTELLNYHVIGKEDWNDYDRLNKVLETADYSFVREIMKVEQPEKSLGLLSVKTFLKNKVKETIEEILLSR